MLFGSTMLEVAIGLMFIYLIMSLIASAINEGLEARLKNRAKDLERGIITLLQNDKPLAAAIYRHPLINGLFKGSYTDGASQEEQADKALMESRKKGSLPSYIPSRTFALALLSALNVEGTGTNNPVETIRARVEGIPDGAVGSRVKPALLSLIDDAQGNLDKLRANLEHWYDASMDRVSGWYKRRVQMIIFAIGFIAAIVMNVDTINIVNMLSNDASLRSSLVAASQEYAKQDAVDSARGISGQSLPPSEKTPDQKLKENYDRLQSLGLPIGWDFSQKMKSNDPNVPNNPRGLPQGWSWLTKIFGLLLTGFAVSFGAPFWFDILNKFMVIRSTVKPREKSPEEASEDRQLAKAAK